MYKQYNEYFFGDIIVNTTIKASFEAFKDTSIFERYMLNTAQFSSAKSAASAKLMQAQIYDEDKVMRSFSKFKEAAAQIDNIVNETWLRTEYETCRRNCVQADQFSGYMADADLYPYWVYEGVMDDRERDEHVALEGQVFKIGDPEGDAIFPACGDNCRCSGNNVDDDYLKDKNLQVNNNAKDWKENYVDERFQFNPATQGPMPNTGSYFDVMPDANKSDYKTFGLDTATGDKKLEGLAAKGMHYLVEIVEDWKEDYHTNKKGDIIFQNDRLMSNVRFNDNSLHAIQKHSGGFTNIPETIENADEVWSSWDNTDKQKVTLRNYILFGKTSYVVQTKDGVVVDALAVSNGLCNKYRKGVII